MSNEKKDNEEGLSEAELEDVAGGAGNVKTLVTVNGIRAYTQRVSLANGMSGEHIKSLFGGLPNGGTTKTFGQ